MTQKILYIDMDGVLVDFQSGINRLSPLDQIKYKLHPSNAPGVFALMDPLPGALDAFHLLAQYFDTYILSTAPWDNTSARQDKIQRVRTYLPEIAHKRLILSHNKHLNAGDYLIDDRLKNGAEKFPGELIHFGTEQYPDRDSVITYLLTKNGFWLPSRQD